MAWLHDPLNATWSTLCTLEDWVRIHLLSARVNCEWRNLFLHSPLGICVTLAAAPPPPELLRLAYNPLSTLDDLSVALEHSLSEALLPIIPSLSLESWRFVARWLRSFPPASPRIRISYSTTKGLGLYTPSGLPPSTELASLWGLPIPIPDESFALLSEDDTSFVTKTYITASGPPPDKAPGLPHVILGPINLANHACVIHASMVPDAIESHPHRPPPTYLSLTDWRFCHTVDTAIPPGGSLTFEYSSLQDFVCDDCPAPLSASSPAHTSWCNQATRGPTWLTPLLAEDWVTFSVIAPASRRPPDTLPSHTVGVVRRLLLSLCPNWGDIVSVLPTNRWTEHTIRSALTSAFGDSLTAVRNLFPPQTRRFRAAIKSFWDFVAKYIRVLDLSHILPETHRSKGHFSVRYSDAGYYVTTTKSRGPSSPLLDLWGLNVCLPREAKNAISVIDNLSSRSLVKFPTNPSHFVHVGPLARCTHACFSCANIIPSTDPFTVTTRRGIPRGYNAGAVTSREIPSNHLLHYSHGASTGDEWWTRGEGDTDFHGRCPFCFEGESPASSPLVDTAFVEEKKEERNSDTDSSSTTDAPPPVPPPSVTPTPGDPVPSHKECLFGAGTYNIRLSVNLFHSNLSHALRALYETDMTILGLTETCARPSSLLCDDHNVADRALIHGSFVKKYKTLWSFMPKHRRAGAGATLIWDARIAYSDPFTDKNGRLAAVTLHGPHAAAVRVICVYAYANPRDDHEEALALRETLESQLLMARNRRQRLIVLGDWQTNLDTGPFARSSEYPAEVALLPLLHDWSLRDTFRRRHPDLHGWTQRQPKCQPGRIDAVWMSKSLLGSLRAPTDLRCHVDQDQRRLCRSDHRLVITYLSFKKIFNAPAGKVRSEQRSAAIPTLNISHLYGAEETAAFHRRLNVHIQDSGLSAALDEFVSPCTCRPQLPPDMWPHPKPAAASAVDVTTPIEHSPCSCAISGTPADAQLLLDKLGDKLQSILIDSVDQPDPRPSKKKPRGYKFRASRLSNLYSRLARLRRRLAQVGNEASLLEAKSDWRVILNTAPVIDNLRLPPLDGIEDATWPRTAALACARAQAVLVANDQRKRSLYIKQKINDRRALHLASFESGSLQPFLRKLRHTIRQHSIQVTTGTGGFTTCPEAIKERFAAVMREWFRSRRSGPPPRNSLNDTVYGHFPEGSIDVTQPLTMEELLHSLRQVPKGSAPGPSGITAELLRLLPMGVLELLRRYLSLCLAWGLVPTPFQMANIYPAPKKGKLDLANCRPISLLEVPFKLLTRVVNLRLMDKLSTYLSPNQWGFRPGHSATDPYHVLLGAVEDSVEFAKPIHLGLVDLTKAFDSTESWSLQQSYRLADLSPSTCAFLGAFDGKGTARVLTPFGPSPSFKIERGVRQGETLSPLKFLLWLEPWLKSVEADFPTHGYHLQDGPRVCVLAYADDIAIVGSSHKEVQDIMAHLCAFLKYHAVTISATEDASSKTIYTHNRTGPGYKNLKLAVSQFSRSSTPGHAASQKLLIPAAPADKPQRYLGGWFNLTLDWAKCKKKTLSSLNLQMASLGDKKLSLLEAASATSTIIQGRASYYLQLAPFTIRELDKLDSSLNKMLRRRGGWPNGTPLDWLHAPRSRGGTGVFSFKDLLVSSQVTELLVRLASPGLVGEVAKSRWAAAQNQLVHLRPSPALRPAKYSMVLYTLWMAARYGYTIATSDDYDDVRSQSADSETIHDLVPFKYHARLEALHVFYLNQLCSEGAFRPWQYLTPERFSPEPRWYRELQEEVPHLPTVLRPLPTRPTIFSTEWTPLPLASAPTFQEKAQPAPPVELSPDYLTFYTDGSLDPVTKRGAYAVIGPPPDLLPVASVPNFPPWKPSRLRTFSQLSDAFEHLGADPISIDTMELMAILALALNPPRRDVLVYSDSSYVVKGCQRSLTSTRRRLRRSNRYLWHQLTEAVDNHRSNGFKFVVAKCAAHGRDDKQAEHINAGNKLADLAAKAANRSGHVSRVLLDDPFTHRLLFRGRSVRGDPRRHMKKYFQHARFELATLVPKGGIIPELIRPPTPFSAFSITTPVSGHKAYRNGHAMQTAFIYAARTNSLYTPSKSYRNSFVKGKPVAIDPQSMRVRALTPVEPGDPPRFPPKTAFTPTHDGAPLCPLCMGANPDTHHYISHSCPDTAAMSGLLRRSVASLVLSVNALSAHATPTITSLTTWLSSVIPNIRASEVLAPYLDGTPQLIVGRHLRKWPIAGLRLPADGLHFGLFPTRLLFPRDKGFRCPFKFRVLLTLPANRTIITPATGLDTDSYTAPVCSPESLTLVVVGDPLLPPVDTASVNDLAAALRNSVVWGPLKLSLRWNGSSWPLDCMVNDPQPILDSVGLLPLDPTPLSRDSPAPEADAEWGFVAPPANLEAVAPGDPHRIATASYWGLLPRTLRDPLGKNLALLPTELQRAFSAELLHCITAGQHQIWCAVQCAIAQVLRYRRRAAIAVARSRPRPRYRPYFVALATPKARYPPSKRILNLAKAWGPSKHPMATASMRDEFRTFCVRHNVPECDRPTLELAILTTFLETVPDPSSAHIVATSAEGLPRLTFDAPPSIAPPPPLPAFISSSDTAIRRGTRVLRGFLPPTDWTIFPSIDAADVRSLLPGNILTLPLIHHLCLRLIEDARLLHGDSKGDFHIFPPTTLPLSQEGVAPSALNLPPLRCDLLRSPTIFLPLLTAGHWILAVITPHVHPPGDITLYSSRRRYGLDSVRTVLRSTFGLESHAPPLSFQGTLPIVTWNIVTPFTPREEIGSKDGGVFLLLHLASLLVGSNISGDQDCSRVRVLLACKLAPPSAGLELNFFKEGPA